nr:DUF4147 domain-containing protein [Thiolinea sp.]
FSAALRSGTRYRLIEAAHPVPDDSSLAAGRHLIAYLQQLPAGEPCLFLISGGASSLCEVLTGDWTLEALRSLTRFMLGAGYDIGSMNAVRQRLSQIKGGRLWQFVGARPVRALLISDVEGDHPSSIGSGLLFPPERDAVPPDLPAAWKQRLPAFAALEPAPAFQWQIVASNALALAAMQERARELGYPVRLEPRFLNGDTADEARQCVSVLQQGVAGIHLWGGETTVRLPARPGRGGRNQHLALSAAVAMQGQENLLLLAAGTDGSDGLSADAGALVDGASCARGRIVAGAAEGSLQRADSGTFLAASGDLIHTGPTGTNVMDVVIGLKC